MSVPLADTIGQPDASHAGCILDLWPSIRCRDGLTSGLARMVAADPALIDAASDLDSTEGLLRRAIDTAITQGTAEHFPAAVRALGDVLELTGRSADSEPGFRSVLERTLAFPQETRSAVAALLGAMLQRDGRAPNASDIRALLAPQGGPPPTVAPAADSYFLRAQAFDYLCAGQFAAAQQIYRELLTRGFEPVGTSTHLARALIAGGNVEAAREHILYAWQHGTAGETYQLARAMYLRALLAAIDGADASVFLSQFECVIAFAAARQEWELESMLAAVRSRLTPATHAQFVRLAEPFARS